MVREGKAMEMQKRILIIGLEGASPELLIPWMDEGKLPNLAKISKNGTIANLTSTLPLVSPVTWTSLSTGKNPGKHGIFGWQQCDLNNYKTYIPLSTDVKAKTFWEILSENGKKVIIINAYLTYPPKPINGIIISGMPSPYLSTYPPELKEELEKEGYKVEAKGYIDTPKDEFIEDLYNTAEVRTKVATKLMESEDWDLFFILFPEIDRLQHCFWKDIEENTSYKQEVLKFYKFIDEKVGELVKKTNGSIVFIVSDHGFRRSERRFHINQWLIKEGYLKLKPTLKNFVNNIMLKIATFLKKTGLNEFLLNFLKIFVKGPSETESLEFEIDYDSSKAFACTFYETSIYINPKLELKEKEKIKKEIIEKLKELKDKNEIIFKEVYRSDEIYKGSFLNISPDIILLPNKGYSAVGSFTFSELFESNYKETGTHKLGGILLANVQLNIKEVSILDIAPTILKLMKVKVEEDFDGKTLI
jgi:predicted AlkP superfamily phosphohydrolase/phosphomutase